MIGQLQFSPDGEIRDKVEMAIHRLQAFCPELCHRNTNDKYNDTYYRCIACGKQTDYFSMPWVAAEAWNKHEYIGEGVQLSFL